MSTITEQIEILEKQTEKLKEYQKLLDKATRMELDISLSDLRKMLADYKKNTANTISEFEQTIREFFHLETPEDLSSWLSIMLSDSARNIYQKGRNKREPSAVHGSAEMQNQTEQNSTE